MPALEEQFRAPVFGRLPRGVRLNSAGEIQIHHICTQASDMDRVRSRRFSACTCAIAAPCVAEYDCT